MPPDTEFAKSMDEAALRSEKWWTEDPFEEIPYALLNREEITAYAKKVGFIYPFDPDKLKPASYQVPFSGSYLYWDVDGEEHYCEPKNPKDGSLVILRPNSITYVGVDAYFRLPHYIALRFNLNITHVHRGLLLGTGPLIDPTFRGRIMIPLHNLTNNEYSLRPHDLSEDLISIEFTKLRVPTEPSEANVKRPDLTFRKFIDSALKTTRENYVTSSVEKKFSEATNAFEKANKRLRRFEIYGTIIGGVTFVGLIIATTSFFLSANGYMNDLREKLEQRVINLELEIGKRTRADQNSDLQQRVNKLEALIAEGTDAKSGTKEDTSKSTIVPDSQEIVPQLPDPNSANTSPDHDS